MIGRVQVLAVVVAGDDVHILVAGIPQGIVSGAVTVVVIALGGPHPNDVVHAPGLELIEHHTPQFLEVGRAGCTPPEPCLACAVPLAVVAAGLVQRTPDDGNALGLQVEEIACDDVDVAHGPGILPAVGAGGIDGGEGGLVGRGGVGVQVGRVGRRGRHVPVPHAGHDAAIVVPVFHGLGIGIVYPVGVAQRLAPRMMYEVEAVERRVTARHLVHGVGVGRVPAHVGHGTRQHILAEVVDQILVELLGGLGGVGVDQRRRNLEQTVGKVVVGAHRERQAVVRGKVVRTVAHRGFHHHHLIGLSALCMEGYDELVALGVRQGVVEIVISGVVGVHAYGGVRRGIYRLVVGDDHIGKRVELRGTGLGADREHLRGTLVGKHTGLDIIGLFVGTCSQCHDRHGCCKDIDDFLHDDVCINSSWARCGTVRNCGLRSMRRRCWAEAQTRTNTMSRGWP